LSRPAGATGSSLRSELLHTSSPSSGDWCAGDIAHGFISTSETSSPSSASCHAASLPAMPPPTTVTRMTLWYRYFLSRASTLSIRFWWTGSLVIERAFS